MMGKISNEGNHNNVLGATCNGDRILCKYGNKCYQKNIEHLKKYRHPSKPNLLNKTKVEDEAVETERNSPPSKRIKFFDHEADTSSPTIPISNDKVDADTKSVTDKIPSVPHDQSNSVTEVSDVKQIILQKFLVEMPEDFYEFWKFLHKEGSGNSKEVLERNGLSFVGPFDILNGKWKSFSVEDEATYLCHWRFFYDPPEFQTVIAGKENEFRLGYFRDDPSELPVFVASMGASNQGVIAPLGDNIFVAVISYLESRLKVADVFKKAELDSCKKSIENYAKENQFSLMEKTSKMKEREKKVVSKSFHRAGIVVPVDKKTEVGYREIPETDACLKKILKKIAEASDEKKKKENFATLQELITNAQWATDEGDFGMGLELGIDLFAYGCEDFHSFIKHLLNVAYDLLDRKPFASILNVHLKNRVKGHYECK